MKNFLNNFKSFWNPLKFGINARHRAELLRILKSYGVKHAYIFGSRARGDYKKYSDIDIAIKDSLDKTDKANLAMDLRESNIPFTVDVVFYDETENDTLKEEIDKEGVLFR